MEIIGFSIDIGQNFSKVLGNVSVWAILTAIGIGMPRQFGIGIGSTQTDTSVVTVLSKFRFR
jgi:hypothetical protein